MSSEKFTSPVRRLARRKKESWLKSMADTTQRGGGLGLAAVR